MSGCAASSPCDADFAFQHRDRSRRGRLRHVQLSTAPEKLRLRGPGTGTNPEQLIAAGWSACFESTMAFVARNMKITLPTDHTVDAEILDGRLGLPGLGGR